MFITVDGFNKTGIPSALWEFMEPYAEIDHVGGIAVLAAVILVLSNLASNVPTGMLMLSLAQICSIRLLLKQETWSYNLLNSTL